MAAEEAVKRAEDGFTEKHEPKGNQQKGDFPQEEGDRVMSPKKTACSSDGGIDHSLLHSQYQAKLGPKLNGSEDSARSLAPLTPGRSRKRLTTQGDDTPESDKSPSVPKFGEWDENDPSSADGYTQIFNIVREERQGGAGATPSMGADSRFSNNRNRNPKGCCCFPWKGN